MKLKQAGSENNFYVTSYSAGIEYGCVTPLACLPVGRYCNNSVQHKHAAVTNMDHIMPGWLYININAVQTSIVFERDVLNNWFEFETIGAFSISDATTISYGQKPGIKK